MNIDINKIVAWLSTLDEMKAIPLTFFLCLAVAIAVRLMPFIRNELLPAIVIFSGPVVLTGLSDFRSSTIITVRVFIFRATVIGFIIGTAAWLVYHYGIRPMKKRFLGDNGSKADEGFKGMANAMLDSKQIQQDSQDKKQTNEN